MATNDFQDSLSPSEVLKRYKNGPQNGVFTDGSSRPNPGPGGWGVVFVKNGQIQKELFGHENDTTNNKMELRALIEGYKLISEDEAIEVFSDSELCVKTINEWAATWEKRGWKRKGGEVKNLELVKELYLLHKRHPKVRLKWIKAHNGWLWNEYADSLSNEWTRR